MATKKEQILPEYSLGGDILGTGLNLWGDLTGTGPIIENIVGKKLSVDNEFLQKVNKVSDTIISPIVQTVAPIALNMAAPGLGSLYSGVSAASSEIGQMLNPEKPQEQVKPMNNIDPRYIKRANGGPLITEMPEGQYGTDMIPTDVQGMPSTQSGKPPIAYTDAGEIIWRGYVFSKDLGFADEAKKIMNKYKLRLGEKFDRGDKYAQEAMDNALSQLAAKQEITRKKEQPQEEELPEFVWGGNLYDDLTKRALSAVNDMGQMNPKNILANSFPFAVAPSNIDQYVNVDKYKYLQTPLSYPRIAMDKMPSKVVPYKKTLQSSSYPSDTIVDPTENVNSYNFFEDPIAMGAVAQSIPMTLRAIRLATQKPEVVSTPKYVPQEIDLSSQREDLLRRSIGAKATATRNLKSNPISQLAAVTAYDEQLGSQLAESIMNEQNANVQERNRAGMFNTQIRKDDIEATAREKAAYQEQVDALYSDISQLAMGVSSDYQKKKLQEKILKTMRTKNFNIDPLSFDLNLIR